MSERDIDARGLACPQPVIMVKQALAQESTLPLCILVDSEHTRENVSRFARSRGCRVGVSRDPGGTYAVTITPGHAPSPDSGQTPCAEPSGAGGVVYLFDADFVGTNRELGKVLTNGFLNAALALPHERMAVVLISNGVRLATEGSYALEVLKKGVERGTRVLLCGTCLDFFKIRNKVAVGTISNALEILECLTGADKIVKM
jgi:selenium metabolism protein YedF